MPKIFRSLEVQSLNIGLTDSVITQDLPKTVLYGLILNFGILYSYKKNLFMTATTMPVKIPAVIFPPIINNLVFLNF